MKSARTSQKQRTREAMLDGARQLMARGETVTIVGAAAIHGISRATAYRYFSDAQVLALEAGLASLVPPYERMVAGTADLDARLLAICTGMMGLTIEHETAFRQYLAHAVVAEAEAGQRGARRVAYMQRALQDLPHALSPQQQQAMIAQLCAVSGIEALVALVDVARVPRADVPALAQVMARRILAQFLG